MGEKSLLVSYLLWFFVGYFGVHRLYLDDFTGFLIYLILWLFSWTGVGLVALFVFWIVDIFLIPGLVALRNAEIDSSRPQQVTIINTPASMV